MDLTGDGGVLKTVIRKARDDALAPSESLPLVDGMIKFLSAINYIKPMVQCNLSTFISLNVVCIILSLICMIGFL